LVGFGKFRNVTSIKMSGKEREGENREGTEDRRMKGQQDGGRGKGIIEGSRNGQRDGRYGGNIPTERK
jgi:hypothetical protein